MTLHNYITSRLDEPFCYGRLDCVLFATDWIKHATGRDVIADLPGWSTEKEAFRVIRDAGGLEKAIDARLDRINPNKAKDGDIALCNGCVMVFSGAHIVGPGKNGIDYIDRMRAECAWSV